MHSLLLSYCVTGTGSSKLVQAVIFSLSLMWFAVVSEFFKEGQGGEPDDVS